MVTTRHSHEYTAHALSSFFETTNLGPEDEFWLIDNDGSLERSLTAGLPRVQVVTNPAPQGFAANVNQVIRDARDRGADLVFLNNDVIFTPGWLSPLCVDLPVVLSPISNFQLPYRSPEWECGPVLDLPDYLGNREAFRQIVRSHRAVVHSYQPALAVPFFAVRIPHGVFTAVGNLDEGFGPGGGEDLDYCLRCHLAGFRVQFALDSYLLHFQGKSTWRGPESLEQRQAREQAWRQMFRDKWGSRLFELVCLKGSDGVAGGDVVRARLARGDFQGVVEHLLGMEDWINGTLLTDLYYAACHIPSDMNGHCPVLADLARECRHVTEMGTRTGVSTTALLFARPERLVCYDLHKQPRVDVLRALAGRTEFVFHEADVRAVSIEETDLLLIDTWHVYEQLQAELRLHASKVRRYLVLHDTTTFGEQGESPGHRGLWPAVEEFLAQGTFRVRARYDHNNGLTVLERVP
jgi:GT2 family glycosyltransferase